MSSSTTHDKDWNWGNLKLVWTLILNPAQQAKHVHTKVVRNDWCGHDLWWLLTQGEMSIAGLTINWTISLRVHRKEIHVVVDIDNFDHLDSIMINFTASSKGNISLISEHE